MLPAPNVFLLPGNMILNPPKQGCSTDLPRYLTVLPVFNESRHINSVLDKVTKYSSDILVVDDGSSDGSSELLAQRTDIDVVFHPKNRGYGAALITAFDYAIVHRYDVVVTIDCDGQHEPQRIKQLVAGCRQADITSGSRYLDLSTATSQAPAERRKINLQVTAELNQQLGLQLTDAFCGFKAYRTQALAQLKLTETGYAMPLELWVQAAWYDLQITEVPVPLIYLEEERSFGGALDAAATRVSYYRDVIRRAIQACEGSKPPSINSKPCEAPRCPCP